MSAKVEWHSRAWICPKCQKVHRVRSTGNQGRTTRRVRCCGMKFFVATRVVTREIQETQIIDVWRDV